ncbi:SRSF protein kinase 2 [Colletotrichum spaethianum]|uniref:non-specific serine/threonine protein kinase n=1 Tax=Colletotrichum spaethianum TaxID=700344 RepID=A0AA37PCY6_9PEZI|nr:SRSF protein kinase 2 [Colletotrichum spaethianum]GKT49985.1 SRSF protein kinase 2 [Colletotrichum spaethianum]
MRLRLQSHCSTTSASTPPVEDGYVDGVEHLGDYRPGVYHPIRIDDRLNERYRVVHKLGHGTFSTAWLAVDEKLSKYVAVKVGTADADCAGVNVLSQFTQSAASDIDPEKNFSLVPVILDRFNLSGPNGTHPCLVTLPARCSLRDAKEASDLRIGNFLLQLPYSLDNLSIQQLYARYGEPEKELVIRLDTQAPSTDPGVPSYAVLSVWLGVPSNEITLGEAKLILSDFGVAFRPANKSRFESYVPLNSVLPRPSSSQERLSHLPRTPGAWAVELQGPLPPEWRSKWEKRPSWYDDAGRPLGSASDIWPWGRRFEQWVQRPRRSRDMETMEEDERDALLRLLGWMLAWTPCER